MIKNEVVTRAMRYVVLCITSVGLAGCDLPSGVCTRELGVVVTPRDTTISTSQSFGIEAYGTSCGGKEILTLDVLWESSDSAVLDVTEAGIVTAVQPGTGFARGVDRSRWGVGRVEVTITVTD